MIEYHMLNTVSDGEFLLLHDGVEQTIDILLDLILKLKAKHYRFVTCSERKIEYGVIPKGGHTSFLAPALQNRKRTKANL